MRDFSFLDGRCPDERGGWSDRLLITRPVVFALLFFSISYFDFRCRSRAPWFRYRPPIPFFSFWAKHTLLLLPPVAFLFSGL